MAKLHLICYALRRLRSPCSLPMLPLSAKGAFMRASSSSFNQREVNIASGHRRKVILANGVFNKMIARVRQFIQILNQRSSRVMNDFSSMSEGDAFYLRKRTLIACILNKFRYGPFSLSSHNNIDIWLFFQAFFGSIST